MRIENIGKGRNNGNGTQRVLGNFIQKMSHSRIAFEARVTRPLVKILMNPYTGELSNIYADLLGIAAKYLIKNYRAGYSRKEVIKENIRSLFYSSIYPSRAKLKEEDHIKDKKKITNWMISYLEHERESAEFESKKEILNLFLKDLWADRCTLPRIEFESILIFSLRGFGKEIIFQVLSEIENELEEKLQVLGKLSRREILPEKVERIFREIEEKHSIKDKR